MNATKFADLAAPILNEGNVSIEKTQNAVDRFLSTDIPEVLAIKGKWGTGKTYYWKKKNEPFLDRQVHASFEKYSYVSLFGVDSLDDLKFTIFQNTVDMQSANKTEKIKFRWKNVLTNWRNLSKSLDVRIPYTSIDIKSISFTLVRNLVVCLDDMERASASIDFKDMLGLVSSLKEQRNCKVILIFNDEKLLSGHQAADYKELKEKVIDAEITFSPMAEESARMIFSGINTIPDKLSSHLIDCAVRLDIRNIRILMKIKRVVDMVFPVMEGKFEEDVSLQAISTLTLLTWSYYSSSHDENVPLYSYIKSYSALNDLREHLSDAKQNKFPCQREWSMKLRQYGYNTDEFDLALADVVEMGYVDEGTFLSKAKNAHEQIVEQNADRSIKKAFGLYHTFDDNEDELVRALCEVVKFARHMNHSQMNGIFTILVEMGYVDEARRVLSEYIKLNEDREGFFDIESDVFDCEYHPEVLNRFKKMNKKIKKTRSLAEVVTRIVETNSWSGEDQQVIAQATSDDFYKIFKDDLRTVDVCLKFKESPIIDNVRSALVRIGRESKLNARRVRSFFDIDVDKESIN